ncbi:MAG TPA: glutamate--tRNA ligase [Gemmatimonadaceae bacterium]|nr:glutamate--tRNA ligase [Gemmatimonadaceae bacterium]
MADISPAPAPAAPRVRFAPSPTGFLHVGGARTALFNWLYARHHGGAMLLRIEDTDRARSTAESTRAIFEGLTWLGIDWDEDVVYQAQGLARHQADVRTLLERGAAYRCFCTQEELAVRRAEAEQRRESFRYDRRCDRLPDDEVQRRVEAGVPHVIRFRVPGGVTAWDDLVHGRIEFPNQDIEDFVVLRSDGTPIYNMAVVSDDIAMRITLVMRGDDHVSNTPKQILLYRALGHELPQFAHVPMIHGTDGRKLSKRHGATAVGDYREQGILPAAMVNFLALLGWSPGGDREVMALGEMIELFSTDGLQKKPAIFDPTKLEWMNGQHLSRTPAAELEALVTSELVQQGLATAEELAAQHDWYLALIDLLKVRARTTHDLVRHAVPYFRADFPYDPDAVAKAWKDADRTAHLLAGARDRLSALPEWRADAMEASLRALADQEGVAAGKIFQPLRVALTGMGVSPGIFEVLETLGRDRALVRIERAVRTLREGG